jgi:hypothetical protein
MAAKPKSSRDHNLEGYRADYEVGDKFALASAIHYCAISGKPLPEWVADAWVIGWNNVTSRAADWNDLLGDVNVRTPGQIKREKLKLERLDALVKLLPGVTEPIERDSEGVFRELSEKMGKMGIKIKPRAVRELYYASVKYKNERFRLLSPFVLRRRRYRPK